MSRFQTFLLLTVLDVLWFHFVRHLYVVSDTLWFSDADPFGSLGRLAFWRLALLIHQARR